MPDEITDVANGPTNGSKIHGTKNDAAVPFQGDQPYGMPNDLVVSKVLDLETTDERLWVYLHFLPTSWNAPTNRHPLRRSPSPQCLFPPPPPLHLPRLFREPPTRHQIRYLVSAPTHRSRLRHEPQRPVALSRARLVG